VQTSGSILYATANRLQINLDSAIESDKLYVYEETIETMINTLYETSLYEIKQAAIKMLEGDIRDMVAGLRRVNREGIPQIRAYLGNAQVKAALAFTMFDRREEQTSKIRLENRYQALLECRDNLENARDFLEPLVY
jgi:hypothetical protein